MIDIINRDSYNNFSDRFNEVKRMISKVNANSEPKLVTLPQITKQNTVAVNEVYSLQNTKAKFNNKLASIISTELNVPYQEKDDDDYNHNDSNAETPNMKVVMGTK